MAILTLEQLKGSKAFKSERVPAPELGGDLLVRDFAGADRDRVVRFLHERKADADAGLNNWEFMLLVIMLALANEDGTRMVPDDQAGEVFVGFGGDLLRRVYDVAARVNGLSPESQDDTVKNSASNQSLDSGTGLPDTSAVA